jgi:hypothetical protein
MFGEGRLAHKCVWGAAGSTSSGTGTNGSACVGRSSPVRCAGILWPVAHHIEAIIGPSHAVGRYRLSNPAARLVDLPQGFALVPVVRELLVHTGPAELVRGFYFLTETFDAGLAAASRDGPLVYVETEYFGGAGGQAAAVYREGRRTFLASTHDDCVVGDDPWPISTGLRQIGVVRSDAVDEFDAVGLDRHRTNLAWLSEGR